MDTPAPLVMKPMMLSPGTGVGSRRTDEAVVQPSTRMPCTAWRARLLRRSGRLVDAVDGIFLVGPSGCAGSHRPDAVDGTRGGHAAVADGGVQIVERGEGQPLEDQRQDLVAHDVGRGDAVGAQLALKLRLPWTMFSSRRSFLNHCLIFVRAAPLLARLSQSRLGPGAFFDVRMSTMSPFLQHVVKSSRCGR